MSTTPILDLEQDPPAPRRSRRWIGLLVGAAIGAGLIPLIDAFGKFAPFNGLLLIPAIYLAVAVHEVGHLFAGKLAGMDPGGIYVGGFLFIKSGSRWIFKFKPTLCVGGFAKPLPAPGDFRRGGFAWMVAGGPIASLALTAAVFFVMKTSAESVGEWTGTLLWASLLCLTSLIPTSFGGLKSDGARLWELWRKPERSRQWIAMLALQGEDAKGVLPRDWNPELVEEVLATSSSESFYPMARMYACFRSAHLGDQESALEHLDRALAACGRSAKVVRAWCFLNAASECARTRKNAEYARVWLDRAVKLKKPESTEWIDADIAMCEGRYEDALRHWAAAREGLLKRKLDSGMARFDFERIESSESECRAALANNCLPVVPAAGP